MGRIANKNGPTPLDAVGIEQQHPSLEFPKRKRVHHPLNAVEGFLQLEFTEHACQRIMLGTG
jgi:hypothetical protein